MTSHSCGAVLSRSTGRASNAASSWRSRRPTSFSRARGGKASGVKRIRVHDIRHSHVSLLVEMGFSALAIAERMGHEAVDITYRYAHLFPTRQDEMCV